MPLTLDLAPSRTALVLVAASGPQDVVRRLAELGLRRGAHLSVVQRSAGGGRVVDIAGSRIALGRSLLGAIEVEPAEAAQAGTAQAEPGRAQPVRAEGAP